MAYVDSTATTFKGGGQALSFKCGSQAALAPYIAGTKTAVDGTFYLTNDTSRLYVGNNGKAVPVNQGVINVASVSALPTTGEHGQFYYAQAENILCVYAGKGIDPTTGQPDATKSGWVQINANTNTEIQGYSKAVAAVTGGVKITDTVTDTNNNPFSDDIEIISGTGITVSRVDEDTISVSAETSTLGTEANENNGKIKMSGLDTGEVIFDVNRGSADNKFVSTADGKVTLHLENKDVKSSEFMNLNQGFDFKIHLQDGSTVVAAEDKKLDPTITYDGNVVHFIGGNADLDVYSKASIDAKIEGINAMHYIGTIGTTGTAGTGVTGITASAGVASKVSTIVNGPESYKIGDTFLVVNNIGDADTTILAGSLLIAMGTEDATGKITSGLYFEVINESYEQDTTYSLSQTGNKVTLQPSTGGSAGSITIVDDNDSIDVVRTGTGADATFTVSHKSVTVGSGQAENAILNVGDTCEVIDSIVDDEHGHVTKVVTKQISLANLNPVIASESISTSLNTAKTVGTITHSVSVKAVDGSASEAKSSAFELKSDTFEITNSDTANGNEGLKINMVWGSFE